MYYYISISVSNISIVIVFMTTSDACISILHSGSQSQVAVEQRAVGGTSLKPLVALQGPSEATLK